MPILASTTFVNAYGKATVVAVETSASNLQSMQGSQDTFVVKYSTLGKALWSARIASTGNDIGYAITTDSSGNVYVTGQGGNTAVVTVFSSDGVAFGTALPSAGGGDAFIVKYDTSGIVQWVTRVASTVADIGFAITTDSSGNVYVTGQGGSGAVVTSYNSDGTAFATTLPNAGLFDAFIVKYNTSGFVQWVARVASTGNDRGNAITTDSSGNVYVTGQGGSATVTAYSSDGVAFGTTLPNAGSGDAFIVKYNTSGIVQWVARVASTGTDIGYAITTDSSGNVYVTGQGGSNVVVTVYNSNGVAFGTTLPNAGLSDTFIVKYDTSGIVQWVARITSSSTDSGNAIATDSSGNVYVTGQGGSATVTARSSNGVAFSPTLPNAGNGDAYIVKYNTSGIVQWVARIASTATDIGNGIATDSSGNVYVTGQSGSAVTVYNSNGVAFGTTLANSGGNDAFIVKYNTSGIVQWVTRIASTGADLGRALSVDSGGNVYTTGQFIGNSTYIYGQSLSLFSTLPNSGGTDAYIVKYNTSGAPQWVARVASTETDIGYAIATDSSGNVYVTGQGGSAVVTAFSSNGVAFGTTLANAGGGDVFIVKYDTSGIVQWVARVATPSPLTSIDIGFGIATDSSGNVYVTGSSSNATVTAYNSDGSAFGTTLPNIDGTEVFIVKYNTSGFVQWAARIAAFGNDRGFGIATDSSGNVYVTGQGASSEVLTAYSSNGVAFSPTIPNSGLSDAFIVKYDTSGIVQWVARVASTGDDVGYGIATDSSGNVYVTGQGGNATVTAFSSDGVAFGTTLPNAGSGDAYIVKYNTSGIVQWVARVGAGAADIGYAIATDSSGNVYVTGQGGSATSVTAYSSNGVAFSPIIPNSGFTDLFLVKYNTNGIVQWVARVGSASSDIGYGVVTDSGGNVYLHVNAPSFNTLFVGFSRNQDIFARMSGSGGLFKYDSNGIGQWAQVIRGPTNVTNNRAVATDANNNVYITGGTPSGQVTQIYNSDNTIYLFLNASQGLQDCYIVKYSSNTTPQWVARVASTGDDVGYGIATDSSGNVYVTGQGGSATVTAYSSDGVAFGTTLPNAGSGDAFIVKYDTSGIVQWVARVASDSSDVGYGISTDSSGNVYVTGQHGFSSTATAFNSDGTAFGTSIGNSGRNDAFLVKYNTSGFVQWVARVSSTEGETGFAVSVDSSGNVYIAGQFVSPAVLTAFSSNGVAFGTTLTATGTETFIVKYDTSGIVQWITRVAPTGTPGTFAVDTDSSGNLYLAGTFRTTATAFSSNGVAFSPTIAGAGNGDAYIVKYDTGGIVQWVSRIASTGSERGYGVATDSSGNVYMTGSHFSGGIVYSSNGSTFGTLLSSGDSDAYIVKYNSSGIVQWAARVGSTGSASADIGYAITTDSDGNVYVSVTGAIITLVAYNSDTSVFGSGNNISSTGTVIVKYNTNGNVQWISFMGTSSVRPGTAITVDSSNNIYTTGSTDTSALIPYSV